MSNYVVNIIDYKKKFNLWKEIYPGIDLCTEMHFALLQFYPSNSVLILSHFSKLPPEEWNPIYFHYYNGEFDPYLMGQADTDCTSDKLFTPWEGANGEERAGLYALYVKEQIDTSDYYKIRKLSPGMKYNKSLDAVLSTRFIHTREKVSDNSIILGFYHIEPDIFERYLVKDLKQVCETFRFVDGDFVRILGASKYPFKTYNVEDSKDITVRKLYPLIENVTNSKIQDPCLEVMMNILRSKKVACKAQ